MELWPAIRSRPPIVINKFAGTSRLDPFSISESMASSSKNLISDSFPAATVRDGQTILGAAVGTKVLGMGVWKDTELHAVFNDGTWRKWTGSAWSSALKSSLSTTAEWSFCNFKGNLDDINLIGSNGVDTIQRYDGSTVQDLTDAPSGGNYIEQFADRLWCAVGNELKASVYRTATDWTTVNGDDADSWYTIVETPNGETINGIKAGLTKLVIAKPSSEHELYGYAPSDYDVRVVTYDIGVFNNKCMAALNGVLYQMDSTGIYRYSGGTLPDKQFSLRFQAYIDNINQTAKLTSCIFADGQKLYVSIPVSSSTAPDTILVYDPRFDSWNAWDNYSALHLAQIGANSYHGDAAGKVHQWAGTDDNGTAITWEWVSKVFSSQSLSQQIRWMKAWVNAYVPSGSTFNVYLSKMDSGDSDWTLVKSLSTNTAVSNNPAFIPTTTASRANYIRVKFAGTGPMVLREFARNEQQQPII